MKQKKVIITLAVVVIVILLTTFVLRLNNNQNTPEIEEEIQTLPTGIVIPTDTIKANELDIVSVSPNDGAEKVSLSSTIRITFSRSFKENEIDFSMGPDAIYSEEIQNNVLIITPWKPLAEGTLYTYSINFQNDNQKVRLYRFVTEGQVAKILPDTRSEDVFAEVEEEERINHPDIYITNRTPFENDLFSITSNFERKVPAHYYFTVVSKTGDVSSTSQAVNAWLQLQGLTIDQIRQLDIRYQ